MRCDRGALRRAGRAHRPPRRRQRRLRRLALQRAPVEHRAAAAAVPGVARLAGGHGAPARRSARADPRVSTGGWDPDGELAARAAEQGIHALPIPTPFAVGRVNVYLLDDDPLTLVDTGPNSGRALDELERGLAALGRRDRGPRADLRLPPAHGPPRARGHPPAALRRRGRGARPAGAVDGALRRLHGGRRRVRRRRHGAATGSPRRRAWRCARSRTRSAAGERGRPSPGRCATATS